MSKPSGPPFDAERIAELCDMAEVESFQYDRRYLMPGQLATRIIVAEWKTAEDDYARLERRYFEREGGRLPGGRRTLLKIESFPVEVDGQDIFVTKTYDLRFGKKPGVNLYHYLGMVSQDGGIPGKRRARRRENRLGMSVPEAADMELLESELTRGAIGVYREPADT